MTCQCDAATFLFKESASGTWEEERRKKPNCSISGASKDTGNDVTAKRRRHGAASSNEASSGSDEDAPLASKVDKGQRSRRRRPKPLSSSGSDDGDDSGALSCRAEASRVANLPSSDEGVAPHQGSPRDAQQRDGDERPFSRKEDEQIVRYIIKSGLQNEIHGLALWKLIK